jgi:hypothetical protein
MGAEGVCSLGSELLITVRERPRMPSANEVQDEILAVTRDLHPRILTQTHSEMADRLDGFASAHQVATNMDAMSKAGTLELVRDGSEFQSYTKKYQLP